jgi:hypothetical protein
MHSHKLSTRIACAGDAMLHADARPVMLSLGFGTHLRRSSKVMPTSLLAGVLVCSRLLK